MRIGVLVNIGYTLDAFFVELVREWEKLGHTVITVAGSPSEQFTNDVLLSVTRKPAFRNVTAPRDIAAWAREHSVDVLLTNNATTSALSRLRPMPVPVVYFCHGLHWNLGTSIKDRLVMRIEKFLLRNTHAVLCMNSDDRKWFYTHYDRERVFYLDYGVGVPLDKYDAADLPESEKLRLLWAGEFSDRKRPGLMLEIAAELTKRDVSFDLQMLGTGTLRDEMIQKVSELGLSGHVSLPGYRPLPEYIRESHLLVHTSIWEGLPRVLLEGRAMQRQSIAFDVKGVRDIPDAVLIPEADVNAFADAIGRQGAAVLAGECTLPPVPPDMDSSHVAQSISGFLTSVV